MGTSVPYRRAMDIGVTNLFIAGLDLGQAADYSALAILEVTPTQHARELVQTDPTFHVARPRTIYFDGPPVSLGLRWLERYELGTSYPTVVRSVNDRLKWLPGPSLLCVDKTGVGAAVVDLFRESGRALLAVTITGGNVPSGEREDWNVPKRDLVHGLLVAMQQKRFVASKNLPLASVLVNELTNFQMKVSLSGHDSYEAWRESVHDDLTLAVAIAAWYAEAEYLARAKQAEAEILHAQLSSGRGVTISSV